jgi:hypothetical protein
MVDKRADAKSAVKANPKYKELKVGRQTPRVGIAALNL